MTSDQIQIDNPEAFSDPAALDDILGGQLKGTGQYFIESGKKYGVNPAFLAAVAMHETGNGTSDAVKEKNNAAGIMSGPDAQEIRSFQSIPDSIDYAAHNLAKNYIGQGLTDLASVQGKYAPIGASNDRRGLNNDWQQGVSRYYEQIVQHPSVSSAPDNLSDLSDAGQFSVGGPLATADIPAPPIGTPVIGDMPGIPGGPKTLSPIGQGEEVSAPTVDVTVDAPNEENSVMPPPPTQGVKLIEKAPDGSWSKFSNGVTYNARDGSISYQAAGNTWVAREGSKPVQLKPKIVHNAEDGRYYDLTDPANPKPVQFPQDQNASATGADALSNLSPADQETVKRLVSYRQAPPAGFAMRSPYWQRIMGVAGMVDPGYNPALFPARSKQLADLTTGGSAGKNVTALNTAINHLGHLEDASAKMGGGSFSSINEMSQWFDRHTGSNPSLASYDTVATALEGELGKLIKGGVASVDEVNQWKQGLSAAQSPAIREQKFKDLINIMAGRLKAIQGTYEQTMGKPPERPMVSPDSMKVLEKHGWNIDDFPSTTPAPSKPAAPTAATDSHQVNHVYTDPVTHVSKRYLGNGQWSAPL